LIDVYPFNAEAPVRIDFFGDEIDAIRTFDPTTQRSLDALDLVTVAPMRRASSRADEGNILGYIGDRADWFFEEPEALAEEAKDYFSLFEHGGGKRGMQTVFDGRADKPDRWYGLSAFGEAPEVFGSPAKRMDIRAEATADHLPATPEGILGIDRVAAEETARRAGPPKKAPGWSCIRLRPTARRSN
jgi:hypothetical protein